MSDHYGYLDHLQDISDRGIALIRRKTQTYGDSWRRRGGRGAWYTLVRPLDRLVKMVEEEHAGDIFAGIRAAPEGGDGTVLDAVRDLRNYLLLVEAEVVGGTDDVHLSDAGHRTMLARVEITLLVPLLRALGYRVTSWGRLFGTLVPGQTMPTSPEGQANLCDMKSSDEAWLEAARMARMAPNAVVTEEVIGVLREMGYEVAGAGSWQSALQHALGGERVVHSHLTSADELVPGTPEDGGHHALQDAVEPSDAGPTPTPPVWWDDSPASWAALSKDLRRVLERHGLECKTTSRETRLGQYIDIVLCNIGRLAAAPKT